MRDRTTTSKPGRRPPDAPAKGALPATMAALALLLGTVLAAGSAAAPAWASPAATPAAEAELQPVVVVMDYSSSMLEEDADAEGTTRLAAAKQATSNLLDNVPATADLGLVAYGSQDPDDCRDITTVQKVGPTDAEELKKRIDGLKAVGETPIGASLLHAAEELEDFDGEKSIILVSDGEENCSEPPACEAATSLAQQGIGLTVHTIGFKVNEQAAEELTCVAEATGGTYVAADNAEELESRLEAKTVRAFQGYVPQGAAISGGETLHSSPSMVPGQYLDTFEHGSQSLNSTDGTLKFYNLGTIQPGERAHLAALLLPEQGTESPLGSVAGISVEMVNGQGESCAIKETGYRASDDGGRPIVAYTINREYTAGSTHGCFADETGQLYAKVMRTGKRQLDTPLPVELKFVLEPAVDEDELVAAAKDEESPQSVTLTGTPEAIAGGGSFNDAAEVGTQTVLSDSVLPEEARYYSVPVGYGQRLNVRAAQGSVENAGPNGIHVDVYSAVRGPVRLLGDNQLHRNEAGGTITQNMRVPVSQSNRDGSVGDDAYLSGDYYVVVSAEKWSSDRERDAYDYELAIEVTGQEQDGPLVTEAGMDGAAPAVADPGDGSATGEDATAEPADGDAQATREDQEPVALGAEERTGAPIPWFLGGLAGTMLVGGMIVAAISRRRLQPAAVPATEDTGPGYTGYSNHPSDAGNTTPEHRPQNGPWENGQQR